MLARHWLARPHPYLAPCVQKEMQSKVTMLSDEVKRKSAQITAQQEEAAQARAAADAANKRAALLETQLADMQVRAEPRRARCVCSRSMHAALCAAARA
jgi:outer membrane murein-binding lipoprotein Lpp